MHAGIARLCWQAAALLLAACTQPPAGPAALDVTKVPNIIVGRSSRAEVFALLGQPGRIDRDGQGERWTWASGGAAPDRLGPAMQAASTVAGAFIPFAGLAGTGLGLARSATDGPPPGLTTFAVAFTDRGVVQDCMASASALPADGAGAPAVLPDCQRPALSRRSGP